MTKKLVLALLIWILLSALICLKFNITVDIEASNGYPVHNLDTSLNYTTIQEAIDANETLNGHTIEVDAGTYYEHVTISKSIFLLGGSRNTTIIDGSGTGPVVTLSANNVSVANFTISNGGHSWSPLDTCIWADGLTNILIENSTVMDVSNGIIFYSLRNSSMSNNLAEECTVMGLHLDTSTNCKMMNNTVIGSFQGMVVEKSAGNFVQANHLINNTVGMQVYASSGHLVEGNHFINNNISMILVACNGINVFQNNSMTSNTYNLIVWGSSIEDFMQKIDTSNIANNKTVYYITNCHNLLLDPSNCPNIGYLALVNCTRVIVKDIDLSDDKDGMLIAQSTNCSLINISLANARTSVTLTGFSPEPLIYGGLTFFKSDNNLIINCRITNNSVGACLYESSGNLLYHNSFVNVGKPVISNFQSPGLPPSGSYSINKWDNDLEGNFWSSYEGTDSFSGYHQNVSGSDGICDTPYSIDANNTDHYPLAGTFSSFNTSSGCNVDIISNSTVEDFEYFESIVTIKMHVSNVTANQTYGFCRICIPHGLMFPPCKVTIDGGEPYYVNYTLYDNGTHRWIYVAYQHSTREIVIIAEFPPRMLMSTFIMATILAVTIYRRRISK
jgi:parallel beta-helix repeat protein